LLGLSGCRPGGGLGIDLERGRPGHPQDNGGHERLHRTSVWNWSPARLNRKRWTCAAGVQPGTTHEALGINPGRSLSTLPRPYAGTPEDLEYPGMDSRRVTRTDPSVGVDPLFISTSLAGWSVGLKYLANVNGKLVWPVAAGVD